MGEIEQFRFGQLEAPTSQVRQLADVRHYEVMTRLDTLCEAGRAAIAAVVEARRMAAQNRDAPLATREEMQAIEFEVYLTARSIIRHLGYR